MDLSRHVDALRQELWAAVDAGNDETRQVAQQLLGPLTSAARLVLLDALSTAAGEITREMAPGSVEIRLRGLDPSFVVTLPLADQGFDEKAEDTQGATAAPLAPPPASAPAEDDGPVSRINFRPPEHLKTRIEHAAGRDRMSVNAWLVRAVSTMLDQDERAQRPERRAPRGGQRFAGWVT